MLVKEEDEEPPQSVQQEESLGHGVTACADDLLMMKEGEAEDPTSTAVSRLKLRILRSIPS